MMCGFRGTDGADADEASLRLEPEDALEDDSSDDVLDRGYPPQDRPWAVDDWGTTARGGGVGGEPRRPARAGAARQRRADEGDGLGDAVGTARRRGIEVAVEVLSMPLATRVKNQYSKHFGGNWFQDTDPVPPGRLGAG